MQVPHVVGWLPQGWGVGEHIKHPDAMPLPTVHTACRPAALSPTAREPVSCLRAHDPSHQPAATHMCMRRPGVTGVTRSLMAGWVGDEGEGRAEKSA